MNSQLGPWLNARIAIFGLAAVVLSSCSPGGPVAVPSPESTGPPQTQSSVRIQPEAIHEPARKPPRGWVRYVNFARGYALYHPHTWTVSFNFTDENGSEQGIAPRGADPVDGPIYLSVDSETSEQAAIDGGCGLPIDPNDYRVGTIVMDRRSVALYRGDPEPNSDGSVGVGVALKAAGLCFRLRFVSPDRHELDAYTKTAMQI